MYFCPHCGTARPEADLPCPTCSPPVLEPGLQPASRQRSPAEQTGVGIVAGFAILCIVSGIVMIGIQIEQHRRLGATPTIEYRLPPQAHQAVSRSQLPVRATPPPAEDIVDLEPLMTSKVPTIDELEGNEGLAPLDEPERRRIYQTLARIRLETFEEALDAAAHDLLILQPGTKFTLSGPIMVTPGEAPGDSTGSLMLTPGTEVEFRQKVQAHAQLWYQLRVGGRPLYWVEMFQLIGQLEGDPEPGSRLLQLGNHARQLELAARASLKLPREMSVAELDQILAEGDSQHWATALPENPAAR